MTSAFAEESGELPWMWEFFHCIPTFVLQKWGDLAACEAHVSYGHHEGFGLGA